MDIQRQGFEGKLQGREGRVGGKDLDFSRGALIGSHLDGKGHGGTVLEECWVD